MGLVMYDGGERGETTILAAWICLLRSILLKLYDSSGSLVIRYCRNTQERLKYRSAQMTLFLHAYANFRTIIKDEKKRERFNL